MEYWRNGFAQIISKNIPTRLGKERCLKKDCCGADALRTVTSKQLIPVKAATVSQSMNSCNLKIIKILFIVSWVSRVDSSLLVVAGLLGEINK